MIVCGVLAFFSIIFAFFCSPQELPAPILDDVTSPQPGQEQAQSSDSDSADDMKIAWRYQNLPKVQVNFSEIRDITSIKTLFRLPPSSHGLSLFPHTLYGLRTHMPSRSTVKGFVCSNKHINSYPDRAVKGASLASFTGRSDYSRLAGSRCSFRPGGARVGWGVGGDVHVK